MNDWLPHQIIELLIPFCQSLIWPLIIVGLLLFANKKVLSLFDAITDRIRRGDAINTPWGGIGQSPPKDAYSSKDLVVPILGESKTDNRFTFGAYPEMPPEVSKARVIRLIHEIGPWGIDKDDYKRRDVIVSLETSPETLLDIIKSVTYYLPDSWPEDLRIQKKSKKSDGFQLKTRAYGEVTVGAMVEFKDDISPLILNRYCNFYD